MPRYTYDVGCSQMWSHLRSGEGWKNCIEPSLGVLGSSPIWTMEAPTGSQSPASGGRGGTMHTDDTIVPGNTQTPILKGCKAGLILAQGSAESQPSTPCAPCPHEHHRLLSPLPAQFGRIRWDPRHSQHSFRGRMEAAWPPVSTPLLWFSLRKER